jgi:GT2 family glycosyltransferase
MKNDRWPLVSIVLATHNRREVVAHTLSELTHCGLPRGEYEIIVVDNASTDGTGEAVAGEVDLLIRLRRNAGSCAKAYGMDRASGRYVVCLDDDSFPRPGTLSRMVERFEADPRLGAAGFTVHLPNGRQEGGALPGVFVGCGVGFRAEALRAVGGLDRTFFMQAEEYDLSFRLVNAGWKVEVFDDLHVEHLKTEHARRTERTTFYDTRNNLRVIARYLPAPYDRLYREDCLQRYAWLAQRDGHNRAFARGARAGRRRAILEPWFYRRRRLSPEVFEHFYRWTFIRQRMVELARGGVRRIILADLGKNLLPFHRAASEAGIEIAAIGDDRFAVPGRFYRGAPVVPMVEALARPHDAVVVSNTGPVHAVRTERFLTSLNVSPVHSWFNAEEHAVVDEFGSSPPASDSDDIPAERSAACAALVGRAG